MTFARPGIAQSKVIKLWILGDQELQYVAHYLEMRQAKLQAPEEQRQVEEKCESQEPPSDAYETNPNKMFKGLKHTEKMQWVGTRKWLTFAGNMSKIRR